MAKPYKIFELYKMHDCESKTGWVETSGTLAIDTDCQENKYSLKLVGSETEGDVRYLYTTPIDLSIFTHLRFFIKGEDCTLRIYLYDSVNHYDYWNVSMPQASWILNTEVIATPDGNSGTAVDYTDIKAIRFFIVEASKTIYFDYIVAYKDITDDVYAPQVHRKVYEVSKGYFKSTLDISDDHCIEIYDENDNLKFEGNIQERSYGNIKEYKLIGFDAVIGDKVSGDYSAQTIETIAKALIDQVSYLRYITGSITTVAGNHTIKITERPFIEQLRKLADLFDGIGYISPDGVVYLDDGSTQCSEPEIFDAEHNFMDEIVGTTGTDIEFVDQIEANITVEIIAEKEGHKKVLHAKIDPAATNETFRHYFSSSKTSGKIEFYIYSNKGAEGWDNGMTIAGLSIHTKSGDGKYYMWNAGMGEVGLTDYDATGQWNHIKIDLKLDIDNIDVYINEVLEGTTTNVDATTSQIVFYQYHDDEELWLDGWDESWASGYSAGRNINGFVVNGKYGLLANNPLLEQIGKPINRIIAYGIMNVATGERLKATANNESSQKLHGIVPFSVRAPHINNQAELDAFATTILSRKGLTNAPKEIKLLKLINLYNLDNLFIGRTIAFKLDAKSYSLYDYICLETYWRGESSILELYLSSGLLHSSEQDVDDSTIDEHQQDESGEAGYESDINTVDLFIWMNTADNPANYYYRMNAVGEVIYSRFFVGNEVDELRDIEITWTFRRIDNNGDTIAAKWNITTNKTDGSTNNANNIEDGTAITLPGCNQYCYEKKTYVLDAADININEIIQCGLELNEASREIHIYNCTAKYYIKRA